MEILEKNWIYEFTSQQEDIIINPWTDLKILDKSNAVKRNFFIKSNCNFVYRILFQNQSDFDYKFFFEWKNTRWDIQFFILSQDNTQIKWNINVFIKNKNISTDLKVISILWENGYSQIYPNINIPQSIVTSQWNVYQETVFLWEKWQTFAQPVLDISSDQIKAFHGVKIQKLDKDKMFYLASKGINNQNSQELMIWWYFNKFFDWFNINESIIKWYLTFFEKKWMNQQIW